MKRALVILLAALVLGALACFLSFCIATSPVRKMASVDNELAWLAAEFQLSPEQTKRIAAMHAEYEPVCTEMCRRIAENNARLDRLIAENRGITTDMEGLLRESAEIQIECRKEMLKHIYAVAAVMSPEQRARYVGLLKMQVLQPGTPYAAKVALHTHD
jgi:hypothetical protein